VKIRTLLTASAAAVVATATALAAPTIASAANGPAPAINVVQPASPTSFESSSGTVATGKVSGIIPARGTSLKKNAALTPTSTSTSHAATAVSCSTEPDCNMPYGGGPVQHTPHVYLILWGPKWSTDTSTMNFVKSFFTDLGQSGDYWSTTVQQYRDKTGRPTFGKSVLAGVYQDKNTPEKTVSDANLGTEAAWAIKWLGITDTNNADVVIAAQQGTCFAASGGVSFAGNCGTPQASGYCAFHDWDVNSANSNLYLPWVNLPYQPDAGIGCGQTFINNPGTNDGYSITGGHELTEAITDPIGTGYVDNADTISGGEVADKCAWGGQLWGDSDPYGNAKIGPGTFAMQSLWSNAVTGCVMNGGLPLSVTTPATQTATLGKAVSLKITASIGGANTPLTYTASGLPGGLSINKSTGVISGTPNVTAGTFTSKVTVAYYAGWHTITFGWQVSSLTGQLKGYSSKCLGDYNASTTAGNKIVIWTCVAGAAQNITFAANRELLVVGKCVTGTTTAFLESCIGATSQQWTRQSNGEYVLKSNGKCLTAPNANNGTQLTLAACANTANQHWGWP
jgi:ricin-type beta-trefoil lectin protein/putative Ig domain-containing protein